MKSKTDELVRASESAMMFAPDDVALADRKQFVRNLGWLLSQTRDQLISCELDDDDIVTITYSGGGTRRVNVRMDSYAAIVRDVAKVYQ